jgi:tetratricopeptide (TPR) repeat protein
LISLNQVLVYTPDSARYLAWSQSLAHAQGFRDNTTPEPSKYVVHAPLYPILIAPTAWITAENVVPAKILTIFFGIALLGAVYWWAKTGLEKWQAVLLCSLLAVHPTMILYSTQVLSDVPFAVCVFLFLALMERETQVGKDVGSHLLTLTIVIVCGLFLREVGLALIVSSTAVFVLKKNYKKAFLILAVSTGFFVLWYLRNEVLVAGVEHPPLQNSQLFFRHLFTPSDVSLLGEFAARLKINAGNYVMNIVQLPFLSEMILRGISSMAPDQIPIVFVLKVMPASYQFLLILTAVVVSVGIYDRMRHNSHVLILVAFLLFYLIPILFYPINDVRFLFSPMIIVLYLFISGLTLIVRSFLRVIKRQTLAFNLTLGSIALIAVPNIAWTVTYVSNNWRYGRSPLEFFEIMRSEPAYPALFARPTELAGKWLAENTDSSTTIISRWKEVGIYTRGRKLLDMDPQTLVDPFENILRDYDVRYIVTAVTRGGLREYEQLLVQSKHYHFQIAHRYNDLEILKVVKGPPDPIIEVSDVDSTESGVRLRFAKAFRMLEHNNPVECERIFGSLPDRARNQISVIFNAGVAKEFEGHLDEAKFIFERFHQLQQAGSIIQPAWYHLEILSKLRDTNDVQSAVDRAMRLQAVGGYYWILGFHDQALLMLDRSIASDSTFFPSLIFRAIYSLLSGDTLKSEFYLERSRRVDPGNVLVGALTKLIDNSRILHRRHSQSTDLATRLDNVHQFRAMGLREDAIDGLLEIHSRYPDNAECLRELVDLYNEKGRYVPERVYLEKLLALSPGSRDLQNELRALESRW